MQAGCELEPPASVGAWSLGGLGPGLGRRLLRFRV